MYKGIIEWFPKWHRHSWRVKSREVGHPDLWEANFQLRRDAGALLRFIWTPSHMWVGGNDKADALAQFGREMHPNNKKTKRGRRPHAAPVAGCGLVADAHRCVVLRVIRGQLKCGELMGKCRRGVAPPR